MRQTCGDCRHFYCERDGRCCIQDEVWTYADDDVCDKFESQDKYAGTLFRQITVSPEVLAKKLVYQFIGYDGNGLFHGYWKSTITDDEYTTKEEAIAATVAKLKEVSV